MIPAAIYTVGPFETFSFCEVLIRNDDLSTSDKLIDVAESHGYHAVTLADFETANGADPDACNDDGACVYIDGRPYLFVFEPVLVCE